LEVCWDSTSRRGVSATSTNPLSLTSQFLDNPSLCLGVVKRYLDSYYEVFVSVVLDMQNIAFIKKRVQPFAQVWSTHELDCILHCIATCSDPDRPSSGYSTVKNHKAVTGCNPCSNSAIFCAASLHLGLWEVADV
jgi:hypothetical protein